MESQTALTSQVDSANFTQPEKTQITSEIMDNSSADREESPDIEQKDDTPDSRDSEGSGDDDKKADLPDSTSTESTDKKSKKSKETKNRNNGNKTADTQKLSKEGKKTTEQILKSLNHYDTAEEKLNALCKKFAELSEEQRVSQTSLKQVQRSLNVVSREKEQLQAEHTKAVLARSKMESLCRELQKHNRLIKEESMARTKIEEEKRKEVANKFQGTINDIQAQMNDHFTKNSKLKDENAELASKMKGLIDQYEKREKHVQQVFQSNLDMTKDKESLLKDKQALLIELSGATKTIGTMELTEQQLKTQVALYTEKYEEFQKTLSRSNEVFNGFKGEMEKMTKKIKKLEKEAITWKSRWENSNKALIDMAGEKAKSDKEITVCQAKILRLEKLCRALQASSRVEQPSSSPTLSNSSVTPEPKNEGQSDSNKSSENQLSSVINEQSNEAVNPTIAPAEKSDAEPRHEDQSDSDKGNENQSSVINEQSNENVSPSGTSAEKSDTEPTASDEC